MTVLILMGAVLVALVSTSVDMIRAQAWRHDEIVNRGTAFLNEALPSLARTADKAELAQQFASSERTLRLSDQNAATQIQNEGGTGYPKLASHILKRLQAEGFPVRALTVASHSVSIGPDYQGVYADFRKLRGIDDVILGRDMPPHRARSGVYSLQLEGGSQWLNFYILLAPNNGIRPILLARLGDAAIGISVALLVAYLIGRVMQPLKRLSEYLERLGRGEDIGVLPIQGSVNVRESIAAFNRMAARLKLSLDYQTALLRSVGHDTKGPIGEIRAVAGEISDETYRDRLVRWVARLEALAASVSQFSQSTRRDGETERIDLTMLVETLVDEEADAGRPVSFVAEAPAVIIGRHNAIIRVFQNLISNALKYGGTARVGVARDGGMATVTVDDDGPGIPQEKMEAAFKPFERMGASGPGSGLGLAIVHTIVVDHGGSVSLENRAEGGLRVIVHLPLEPAR